MLGDYDSLPDRYTLSDYRRETAGYDVRGVIWSDAGAADPLAAADWAGRGQDETPPVMAMVTLADPASEAFAGLATAGNVATRIDALGTIFGDWTLAGIRPWLLEVVGIFGPQRCMLGSDLPIENLRSGFGPLFAAYDAIFCGFSGEERAWLFHRTAELWYATATGADA